MKLFEITDEAKNQIEKLLEKNPGKYAVSLAVQGGGCAGFKYEWGFADTKENVTENSKPHHKSKKHKHEVEQILSRCSKSLIDNGKARLKPVKFEGSNEADHNVEEIPLKLR